MKSGKIGKDERSIAPGNTEDTKVLRKPDTDSFQTRKD